MFDGYGSPSIKDIAHHIDNTVNIWESSKFKEKKDNFLNADRALIGPISKQLYRNGYHSIEATGEGDIDIVKAAIAMSSF